MKTIKEIFLKYGQQYIDQFQDQMPNNHLSVIQAIIKCKTDSCGFSIFKCEDCHTRHFFPLSCGNRHCPNCGMQKSRVWLEKQLNEQLPGAYFMITFTMPAQLRNFIRANQRQAYSSMFGAAADSMKKIALDQRHIGGNLPGFFGVLHTWGKCLQYHPHIHFIVAGGAFTTEDQKWHKARNNFYLPVKALSIIYRAKFKNLMNSLGLLAFIPKDVWQIDWNVNCKAVGNANASMKYLAPYVFRVAISDSRIIKVENRLVYFKYKKQKSRRQRVMKLDVLEFIRRFLQHVLPRGFVKIRHYGFMNKSCRLDIQTIRRIICETLEVIGTWIAPRSKPKCPDCQGKLIFWNYYLPVQRYTGLSPGDT
jgi:hypothetical protein